MIIRGKVYDVTSWVPKHPGGSLIYVKAGYECTQLFESYHPLYVSKMLDKFYIGDLEKPVGAPTEWGYMEYNDDVSENSFYNTLKARVEAHFKSKKINPRNHPAMVIKSFVILFSYAASFYFTFFGSTNMWLKTLAAASMGFFAAEFGMSIQHDANHGAYTDWLGLGYFMSLTLDCIGLSSFMWRQEHVVGHHAYTNVAQHDPDLSPGVTGKQADVLRMTDLQPQRCYHAYQQFYMLFLYSIVFLKSIFLNDFQALADGYTGVVRIARMTPMETFFFWSTKVFYVGYMFVLPALYSPLPGWKITLLYIFSQVVVAWILISVFQVAHVVEEVDFHEPKDEAGGKIERDWAKAQVASTVDFAPGSSFWLHLTGGLSCQIEHHLFPGVCHVYYPQIAPIVKQTCEEFDVPYNCHPSLWAGLQSHYRHMRKMGMKNIDVRLDG
jgi:fatty acid desaturase